ncbi:MAG: hypothetical protein PUC51_08925 [Ruminococcus sp.]|nr:hypothetical protein [Ruminococcus sp.]
MKKRIIIGILIAALVAGGSAGGATYYKKSHQKTVSVVSVDNLAGQYYMDDTNLDGNIVTSAIQNITVDKDMIIQEVYVSKGDEVKKDDKLISFDMTLVQMELNIAKLKQQQQEQELNKATNRLNSLKNGGAIEESDADTSDTSSDSDTDTDSGMDGSDSSDDGDEIASVSGNVNGVYLAAVMNPILAAAVNTGDISEAAVYQEEDSVESDVAKDDDADTQNGDPGSTAEGDGADANAGGDSGDGNNTGDNTGGNSNTGGNNGNTGGNSGSGSGDSSGDNNNGDQIDIIDGDDSGNSGDNADDDFSDSSDEQIDILDTDEDVNQDTSGLTDGNPMFYQVLDGDSKPLSGKGTKKHPYVFLCSSAKGYVVVQGSFLNKMAAFDANGNKEDGKKGYWYQLEFHQNDTVEDLADRKKSCTGYYLVDGSLLETMVPDYSEVEFTLADASHYDHDSDDDNGDDDGDYDGDQGDSGNASISREDAIKIQQNKVESLKLDIRESKLNIEKLEKKVKKEVIYSKLDGTVAKVGDPATTASDGSDFMTIKSKEGFYVKGTVSELMLDQIKEGTILNCSGQSGDFEAEVVDVSEYPVSGDNYSGNGNPNVSYYSYTATIPDKSVKVSDDDYWLTITLQSDTQSKGIVLDRAFVRSENGNSYVYKDDNGVLKKQKLIVGGNVNGGYSVLVTGGITRDDKIAFPYGDTVKEGAKTQEVSVDELYGY